MTVEHFSYFVKCRTVESTSSLKLDIAKSIKRHKNNHQRRKSFPNIVTDLQLQSDKSESRRRQPKQTIKTEKPFIRYGLQIKSRVICISRTQGKERNYFEDLLHVCCRTSPPHSRQKAKVGFCRRSRFCCQIW